MVWDDLTVGCGRVVLDLTRSRQATLGLGAWLRRFEAQYPNAALPSDDFFWAAWPDEAPDYLAARDGADALGLVNARIVAGRPVSDAWRRRLQARFDPPGPPPAMQAGDLRIAEFWPTLQKRQVFKALNRPNRMRRFAPRRDI